jgi:predicted MPP superfamily phosphohydrolase
MIVLSTLLFLVACIGHTTIPVVAINWLYGTRYRGWWVSLTRHALQLNVVAGPPLFLTFFGRALWTGGRWLDLPAPLLAYLAVCWVLGGLVVPAQTVRRWLRRPPALQLANHTQTFDVAAELGYRPYGRGEHRWLAYFPGNEIFQLDVTERTYRLPQLPPAWDGLMILHVSDLHLCGMPDLPYFERVMDRCAALAPDLVAVTGDILDSDEHYHWIKPVLGRLRWRLGAFAILGNHDSWLDVPRIIKEVSALGIELVGGRWARAEVRGAPLVVIGNEMPWLGPLPDLSECPEDGFRLCLSHSPDQLPWARRHRIDLMLAGHNHGGQVRVPGFGPVLVPSRFSRRYDCGTFHEPPTVMHVSRGVGGTYPLRCFCRPEVTFLILRSGPGSADRQIREN